MSRGSERAAGKTGSSRNFILAGDWTFVTRNSVDFRGPVVSPGLQGQYAGVPLHAGLVCINGPEKMTAGTETDLFGAVLEAMGVADLVNEAIEINLAELSGEYEVHRYALPNVKPWDELSRRNLQND